MSITNQFICLDFSVYCTHFRQIAGLEPLVVALAARATAAAPGSSPAAAMLEAIYGPDSKGVWLGAKKRTPVQSRRLDASRRSKNFCAARQA
jgi:hypothetical protein